jgi:hypothetical protein
MRVLPVLLVCTASVWSITATAEPSNLKGEYAFTGAAHCINSASGGVPPSPGFDARNEALCSDTGQPIDFPAPGTRNACPGVFATTFSIEGVRSFNGDGTGTVKARTVSLTVPTNARSQGASHADIQFSFTYTLDGEGGFTTNLVPGTFVGTVLSGQRAGQTFTIDSVPLAGLISTNGHILTLATVTPNVETQTFSNGDVRKRICHRSRVLTEMKCGDGQFCP